MQDEPAEGKMTYRITPTTKDKVSVLGYGMMRLPTVGQGKAKKGKRQTGDEEIDQNMVNKQIDYALKHGLNYFDTAPVYCKGQSERATGIALKRHPRNSYYIATKLSNFGAYTREESIEMFNNSLKELQTTYIDYYLLHAIGGRDDDHEPMELFNARFIDNGMLDYCLQKKKEGAIRNLGFSYHGDIEVFNHALKLHDEGKVKWDFVQIEMNYLDWHWANEINEENTDACYLYNELNKRGIPAIIMEPLLGGRLANLPDPVVAKLKSKAPERSVASWAFRYCASYDNVLTELSGTPQRQPPQCMSIGTTNKHGKEMARRTNRKGDNELQDYSLQRLQILYALPLRCGYSGHFRALQPSTNGGACHRQHQRSKLQKIPQGIPRHLR